MLRISTTLDICQQVDSFPQQNTGGLEDGYTNHTITLKVVTLHVDF